MGVEGVTEEIILKALKEAGCEIDGKAENEKNGRPITKTDLYLLGLSGGAQSVNKRKELCESLGVPSKISANMLVGVLNRLMSYEQLEQMIK